MFRYSLDRVGESEWVLFDCMKKGTPKTYLLFLAPVKNRAFNYQLVLTAYDASLAGHSPLPVFTEEIYSTFFYSVPDGLEPLIMNVFYALQDMEIDDPLELAYSMGGTVKSERVRAPTIHNTN
jgi:hypothetical protein